MGFYIRKFIKVGPFRFNLSKSGVGLSVGVKGLRLGTVPRGNYVHMGRYGLYYRATIPSSSSRPVALKPKQEVELEITPGTHEPLQEIESSEISNIVDSSSAELLKELNQKCRKIRLWPFIAVFIAILLFLGGLKNFPLWLLATSLFLGIIVVYVVYQRDLLAKTTVIFYEFDPEMEKTYAIFHQKAEKLASCNKVWHIAAEGRVLDRKYHAGASKIVRRNTTFVRKAEPPYVKTNVETIAIGVGRQVLHFFPDRILVYDYNGVGAVGYDNLKLEVRPSQFIESNGVPADAKVVDYTWRYVNKKGGPDRRFKDNPKLPVCMYDEISFTSQFGLNEVIQLSCCDIGEDFIKIIQSLANKLPKEVSPPET